MKETKKTIDHSLIVYQTLNRRSHDKGFLPNRPKWLKDFEKNKKFSKIFEEHLLKSSYW